MKASPHTIPRSRYLLFVGALLAITLLFLPWVTAKTSEQLPVHFGPTSNFWQHSAIGIESRFLGISNFSTIALEMLQFGSFAPGILCSIWVRERIQSRFQLLGVVVFSAWVVLLTCLNDFSLYGLLANHTLHQTLVMYPVLSWRPEIGMYLLIVTQGLFWVGLGFVWAEIYQNRHAASDRGIQRQLPSHYLAASLTTLGAICWFVGYYGFYWFLPENCPAPAPFEFAQCNNRLDAPTSFFRMVNQNVISSLFWGQMLWLALETLVVVGGIVLLTSLWVRKSKRSDVPWITVWLASIILLSGISLWATKQLAMYYVHDNEQLTGGFPLTLLGLFLLATGLCIRWQKMSQHEHPESQEVGEKQL